MVINEKGGCKGKKVARKHLTKGKNELRLSHSSNEKYAIVKKLLGNTCDVICDDGKERRCMIRGKFTGRNKRDNMIDSGVYILVMNQKLMLHIKYRLFWDGVIVDKVG